MKIRIIALFAVLTLLIGCGSTNKVRTTSTSKPRVVRTKPTVVVNTTPVEKEEPTKSVSNAEELEATSKIATTSETVSDYILNFKEVAKSNMMNHGIPASITLAQGILESGAGKGRLCLEANNHFGIKCHTGWTGPSITHDDDAAQECFRKYSDPADSYRDHSLFLTSRSRYSNLFKLDKLDYKGWAKGLKDAGYATDPKYPSKLIGIIERYQLYLYDHEVVAPNSNTNNTAAEVVVPNTSTSATNLYTIQQGDTLYSLSKRFNLTVEDLKRINNMSSNAISIGQTIKIK